MEGHSLCALEVSSAAVFPRDGDGAVVERSDCSSDSLMDGESPDHSHVNYNGQLQTWGFRDEDGPGILPSALLSLPQNCKVKSSQVPTSGEAFIKEKSSLPDKDFIQEDKSKVEFESSNPHIGSISNSSFNGKGSHPASLVGAFDEHTSATSLNSIGMVSDLDLLSPISRKGDALCHQTSAMNDLRLSLGSLDDSQKQPHVIHESEEDCNSVVQATIFERALPSSAKRVLLRLENIKETDNEFFPTQDPRVLLLHTTIEEGVEEDFASDDDDDLHVEEEKTREDSTRERTKASPYFEIAERSQGRRSVLSTSLSSIDEEEPCDEEFANNDRAFSRKENVQDSPRPSTSKLLPENLNSSRKAVASAPLSSSEDKHQAPIYFEIATGGDGINCENMCCTQLQTLIVNGEEHRVNDLSMRRNDGNVGVESNPHDSQEPRTDYIVESESARSMSLIQRLRKASFRRSMNSTALDTLSLSLLDDVVEDSSQPTHTMAQSYIDVLGCGSNLSVDADSWSSRSLSKSSDAQIKCDAGSFNENPDTTLLNDLLAPTVEAEHIVPLKIYDGSMRRQPNNIGQETATESQLFVSPADIEQQQEPNTILPSIPKATLSNLIEDESSVINGDDASFYESHEESAFSSSGLRFDEIVKTTRDLGASSSAFIQQLRGAAFRRKKELARSRDSLAAKEREQRKTIATYEAARMHQQDLARQVAAEEQRRRSLTIKLLSRETFKARPLPETTGVQGSGGLAGVPKVEKKPTTTPISPYLGPRRYLRQHLDPDSEDHHKLSSLTKQPPLQTLSSFKALPLPMTTGQFGDAGQAGVPKVQKRKITIPHSPLLGFRRMQKEGPSSVQSLPKLNLVAKIKQRHSNSSQARGLSQSILGADLCSQKENDEAIVTPRNNVTEAYIPHSTDRAKKRAEFEIRRTQNEQIRYEDERRDRERRVQALRKELTKLRMSL